MEPIREEKQDNRDWFLSNACSYTPVVVLNRKRNRILVDEKDTRQIIHAGNALIWQMPLTAEVLISKEDGIERYGSYVLRAMKGFNEQTALRILKPRGIIPVQNLFNEYQTPYAPLNNNSLNPRLLVSSGPVQGVTMTVVLYQQDHAIMKYIEDSITGGWRIGFGTMVSWIKNWYTRLDPPHRVPNNFPVRDIHYLALRVESFMGRHSPKLMDHHFPCSKQDALRVLSKRPVDYHTPVLMAAANGQKLADFQKAHLK